jgi:hypothetical protein
MTLKKDAHVYIITKEGRIYTDEGLDMLRKSLAEHGCTNPTFVMGAPTNNPKVLAGAIRENSDGIHIVLSHKTGVIGINPKDHDLLYHNLTIDSKNTSYNVITKTFRMEP